MQGYNALWLPGMDHAGIATQNVVERELAKEGLSRHDLGREKFVEIVWDWLREYGGKIMFQFRRIGASLDYRRPLPTAIPVTVKVGARLDLTTRNIDNRVFNRTTFAPPVTCWWRPAASSRQTDCSATSGR